MLTFTYITSTNMKAYVITDTFHTFKALEKAKPEYECEMIVEPHKLRGREPAKIIVMKEAEKLWNYQDFLETVDRCMQMEGWKEANDELLDDEDTNEIKYAG